MTAEIIAETDLTLGLTGAAVYMSGDEAFSDCAVRVRRAGGGPARRHNTIRPTMAWYATAVKKATNGLAWSMSVGVQFARPKFRKED
jgi:hypothetical protein